MLRAMTRVRDAQRRGHGTVSPARTMLARPL